MSKAQHTPGPWQVMPRSTKRRTNPPAIESDQQAICFMASDGNVDREAANALLIAAAPTLLEACKAALPFIEWFREMQMKGEIRCSPEALQQASDILNLHDYDIRAGLEAAIAKAEGKS